MSSWVNKKPSGCIRPLWFVKIVLVVLRVVGNCFALLQDVMDSFGLFL